ncbi:hypothetical protein F383_29796 [Gossypium arboreum]|uniref:Protein phosphatase n=1 Tax=Gossypium arboreum TaxID=29729 RepID=A0A0B0N0L3_GOSAR|nr:hypothetical protein F383_29796 [Gossypium arboreum]
MANSIYRASMLQSYSQLLFQPCLSNKHCVPKKTNLLCFASSQLNPARSEVSFCTGTHLIPHPNKVERGGEDAFFVSNFKGGVIAVADGVSGWAEQNVDPSLFSKELMANASSLVGDLEVNYDPQILIRKAHAATGSKGSATASVELVEGDTIVMGSDGLFDNVFDGEIVSTLAAHSDVVEAAKALANLASNHSLDSRFDSPYTIEARSKGLDVPFWKKFLGMKLTGGKLDDITVIVGQVITSAASPQLT